MTPSLSFTTHSSEILHVLALIGFGVGLFLLVKGFGYGRKRANSSKWTDDARPLPPPAARSDRAEPKPNSKVEVIRLSENSSRGHIGAMTQQQKIAAALQKAAMSNPAAWKSSETEPDEAVKKVPVVVLSRPERDASKASRANPISRPGAVNFLWIFAGAVLALVSFYFLLRLRNAF